MTSSESIAAVADRLHAARAAGAAIAPVRRDLPPKSVEAAYAVQALNVSRALCAGRSRVGRKIGLTSEAVQRQMGVDQPDFGVLFDHMDWSRRAGALGRDGLIAPRIEAEFAMRLGRDLARPGASVADLGAAVSEVCVAFEIVDSAIAGWDIDIVDTVADNASSAGFVLGPWRPFAPELDLPGRGMRMLRDGEIVSTGSGAACLGDPLNALGWLAEAALRMGDPLRGGEIILTGALGPMVAFAAGDYRVEIDGFDPLQARAL